MKKFAVIALLVAASVLPVTAQDAAQPPVLVPDVFDRAITRFDAQDYEGALRDYSLFLLLNPTSISAYYWRGLSNYALEDYDRALSDVERAITMTSPDFQPEMMTALYGLRGDIHTIQSDFAAAIDDYSAALTITPTPEALVSRASIYFSRGDLENALSDFDAAIDLQPNNPALYIYRGMVNIALDETQAAGADYLRFFQLFTTDPVDTSAIQSGQTIRLQVDRGVVFYVPFQARSGQLVSAIAASNDNTIDPLMVLIDANGDALTGDDDSGTNGSALILDYRIPADGMYALVVGHSLGGFTGEVIVRLLLAEAAGS